MADKPKFDEVVISEEAVAMITAKQEFLAEIFANMGALQLEYEQSKEKFIKEIADGRSFVNTYVANLRVTLGLGPEAQFDIAQLKFIIPKPSKPPKRKSK